jgi:transcriptional regulator of nitric oxide reductase
LSSPRVFRGKVSWREMSRRLLNKPAAAAVVTLGDGRLRVNGGGFLRA